MTRIELHFRQHADVITSEIVIATVAEWEASPECASGHWGSVTLANGTVVANQLLLPAPFMSGVVVNDIASQRGGGAT